jgi:hypothetical protein
VAGRVDDVDLVILPADRRVLGEDGDAALPLERVRVHHALLHLLVVPEGARLAEHLVDEGGLPVIDVCDDGDVAQHVLFVWLVSGAGPGKPYCYRIGRKKFPSPSL